MRLPGPKRPKNWQNLHRVAKLGLEKDPIVELKASLASELGEDDYYKILESKSVWIQNRVNPVLKALTFQAGPSVRKLVDAIEHFKEKDGAVDKSAPAGFLDPEEGAAVQKEGKFRVSLYKALLFLHVQSGIKSGALNLEHSYKYRPLDDYLIDRVRWQRDKQHLIERAGLEALVDPRKVLKELDEALSQQYLLTNQNITEGKNPHIKFSKNGGFTLATPKQEESDAEPLQQFFPDRRFVPLVEILATVNRFSHYVDELQHPQQRYHHGKPSEATIYAGMIGIGCTIGLRRMMRISRGVTEAELEHTVNWHFSLDGLQAANDRVLRLMDRLELPNLARRLPDQLHTSSDGQKFEVRVDSLNANYSFKYFGKDQGVAAYTFRDERDLLWYSTVFQLGRAGKRLRHRRADAQRGGEERYSFDRCLRLQRVGLRREPPVGLFLRAALQKSRAPEALYLQESQGVRPFRLEDQARRLCR
jgi:hypothetical protein